MIIVLVIVFCHGFYSLASSGSSFSARYGVDQNENLPKLAYDTMKTVFSENGFDSTQVNYGGYYYSNNLYSVETFNNDIVHGSVYQIMDSLDYSGVTIDVSNSHVALLDNWNYGNWQYQAYFVGSGRFAVVNRYYVSDESFKIYFVEYVRDYTVGNVREVVVNSASDNGFYCYDVSNNNGYGFIFHDFDVFMSTSDSSSGFMSFDTSSTDFSFDNDNYNFNYLKTGDYIVSPADPEEEEEELQAEPQGQFYNYASVSGEYAPSSNTSLNLQLRFGFNEYMRRHPEEYMLSIDYYVIPGISEGNHYFQAHHEYKLNTITGYGHYTVGTGDSFSDTINFNELVWNTGNVNLKEYLVSVYNERYSNTPDSLTADDIIQNILNFTGAGEIFNQGSIGDLTNVIKRGEWELNSRITWLTSMQSGAKIRIRWVGGEPETSSGALSLVYETGKGTQVKDNSITQNFNPPSEYNPQYPEGFKDSQGNPVINGNPVSTNVWNNLNAQIEYLFNVDFQEYMALTGNIANNFQYVINTVSDGSENGFFAILKRTYDLIPDEIWSWIKVSVGVILAGCSYTWIVNGVRIKRG